MKLTATIAAIVISASLVYAEDMHVVAMVNGESWNVETESGVDVKATGSGEIMRITAGRNAVKLMHNMNVAALTQDGVDNIIARSPDGETIMNVVATQEDGEHILDIKAVTVTGEIHGVKAFGKDDNSCFVKGLDISPSDVEGRVWGVEYMAHVKALCM